MKGQGLGEGSEALVLMLLMVRRIEDGMGVEEPIDLAICKTNLG